MSRSDVVFALIGKRWLGEGQIGGPGIQDPQDIVHLEIAAGLSRKISVVPVLVDGSSMPTKDRLPLTLQPLTRGRTLELSGAGFRSHMERVSQAALAARVPPILPGRDKRRWRPWIWYASFAFFLVLINIAAGLWLKAAEAKQTANPVNNQALSVVSAPAQDKKPSAEDEHEKQEARKIALLARGKAADDKLRLTIPAEDDATLYYHDTRRPDPNHSDAHRGPKSIGKRYVNRAEEASGERQFGKAAVNLEMAGYLTRDRPVLAGLGRRPEEVKMQDAEPLLVAARRKKQKEFDRLDDERAARASLAPGTVFRDRLKSGGAGPEMVVIPGGTSRVGDLQGRGVKNQQPVHTVRIEKPFAIGRYEVTFEEYERFAKVEGRKPPYDKGWGRHRRPVIYVTWKDAWAYAQWLSAETGERYRLPTEAEWEYAARANSETAFWWGEILIEGMANCSECGGGWEEREKTAPVGSFKPNQFGLYDTAGNVWEWLEDCWHKNYDGAPADGSAWLEAGSGDCGWRVIRGGSWDLGSVALRSSVRARDDAVVPRSNIGFRVARDIQ